MSLSRNVGDDGFYRDSEKGARSHSAQGLPNLTSSTMKIPLPPKLWITDIEDDSSDDASGSVRDEGVVLERPRVRSRFRHHKTRISSTSVPIGIFWDIENCQVPRGCSPIDVVSAIRAKFLQGRREADFVVVCDVRKEAAYVLQELNDAQVSLIHVCGTQKNAADEKLRQCMRRFAELHTAPAALLLISGDINFASDLSDFRHRKNMEVLLMHKQNTSSALIACASSHYCYNQLTANLPRNSKNSSFSRSNDDDEDPQCELEVSNIPLEQSVENISRRLRRLADNCGGKVIKVYSGKALLKFPTPDHALRALKRMDGEDVYGRKIMTRYARSTVQQAPAPAPAPAPMPVSAPAPVYSSDEGYSTAPNQHQPLRPNFQQNNHQQVDEVPSSVEIVENKISNEWALALQQLPAPTPPPLEFCPPPAPKPRKIRGTHGSVNLDRSGCSSSNSGDDSRMRAVSPWNSSTFSEQSETDAEAAELTVGNLPPYEPHVLQEMLTQLFNQYVPVVRVSVWVASDGPLATIVLRSEWDARLAIARVHKRRLVGHQWTGRRLELSLGRPSPAPNLDVLKARLRAILLDQKNHMLPLLRLRDAYASRHCCALTTSDIGKVRDIVVIHENYGRMVQLIDLTPVTSAEMEEAPWKCHMHASMNTGQDDGSRMLQPVFMEVAVLAKNAHILLENHGGILPLLSFVDCYEATFQPLIPDPQHGVALELLLRNVSGLEVKDSPSRHLTWRTETNESSPSNCSQSDSSRSSGEKPRTAPALEPMLALFERELIDLLRTAPRCTIPFCKLIPAFHHHFGRQCRVADYGFTRLPDLLAALSNTIVVLGSGSSRVITISAAAQSRRWTSDLVKLLKAQPGKSVSPKDIPELYQATFGKMFNPVDYGVCTVGELMQQVGPQSVTVGIDGTISLPRHEPTPAERARTVQFAIRTVELLCCTPNLRMEFSRFVPAYHSHYGRQLRVAHYGCVKLVDLFEMIPDVVSVCGEPNGERAVKLTAQTARCVVGKRLNSLAPIALVALPVHYARQYGAAPQPDMLDMRSLEELVYAAGGCIENGVVIPPGSAWRWTVASLSACAALCADRSVARGSTLDYFTATYRRITSTQPDIPHLVIAGVIRIEDSRVMLSTSWRIVFRIAQILAEKTPSTAIDIFLDYTKSYEPVFPGTDSGLEGFCEYLRQYGDVFVEVSGRYSLAAGVVVPKTREMPSASVHEDYSIHDTPPGQKGSRVFDSPKHNIWCSPPASALPTPTALLTLEKRRTRLAAQFDVS